MFTSFTGVVVPRVAGPTTNDAHARILSQWITHENPLQQRQRPTATIRARTPGLSRECPPGILRYFFTAAGAAGARTCGAGSGKRRMRCASTSLFMRRWRVARRRRFAATRIRAGIRAILLSSNLTGRSISRSSGYAGWRDTGTTSRSHDTSLARTV
jgi:hypothetical protein